MTRAVLVLAILLFAVVLLRNAWVVDDAYITFRTIDNFVHGYGLTWNVDERVQAYTHPLWLFVLTFFYLFTHEAFYTSIVVSLAFSLAAVIIAAWWLTDGFRRRVWRGPLLLVALLASKAVIDYTSSGLENPLSYVLVAVLCAVFVEKMDDAPEIRDRRVIVVGLLASCAFLTHPDMVLLFLPAVLVAMLAPPRRAWRRTLLLSAIAALPAAAWLLFSLLYYGFPLPNTAYAKAISNGFPLAWKAERGMEYFANSLSWDAASYVMVAAAIVVGLRRRRAAFLILLSGVVLDLVFVLLLGAAGTHMSGRFVSVPLFAAIVLFVSTIDTPRAATVTAALLLVFMAMSPLSAVKFGTPAYRHLASSTSCIDTKWFVYQEGAALLDWRPGKRLPDHAWYHEGERLRNAPEKVLVGGPFGSDAIGYFGFAAGPGKFIVDRAALSDPLLARLPAIPPPTPTHWKSGHFFRAIPDGYLASVTLDRNLLTDPSLHRYYDAIRSVTRAPLFTMARLRDIWNLNTGWHK